ncbi:MAG: IS1 family transposase, partial [Clostridia bacterium]|nr:IS1 family transposase [Clostridia bacterium]
NWETYNLIDPNKRLIGKAHTYTVERMNRLLRYYLARFTRKTYCSSKSLSMISDSVLLFYIVNLSHIFAFSFALQCIILFLERDINYYYFITQDMIKMNWAKKMTKNVLTKFISHDIFIKH